MHIFLGVGGVRCFVGSVIPVNFDENRMRRKLWYSGNNLTHDIAKIYNFAQL